MVGITQSDASQLATGDELGALRAELDRVDVELLDALRARVGCCRRIAHHKRDHGVPMMQPHRIDVVQPASCPGCGDERTGSGLRAAAL